MEENKFLLLGVKSRYNREKGGNAAMRKSLKIVDKMVILLFSLSFILTTAFVSIIPIASNNAYYLLQFEKNGIGQNLNYTIDQLKEITAAITGYMFRGKNSMQVYFDGKAVFSDQAISHMADVKVLFVGGTILGYISLILFLVSLIYLFFRRKEVKRHFRRINYCVFLCFMILVVAVAIYAFVDFDSAFVNFHHLIFPDPEKFDNAFFPNDDTLINILTMDFFFDVFLNVVIRIAAIFFVYFFVVQSLYGKVYAKIKSSFSKKLLR